MASTTHRLRHAMRTRHHLQLPLTAASIACFTAIAPTYAQTRGSETLEEVTVVAKGLGTTALRETPIPMTVITPNTLAETSQLSVKDYYTRVPGLNFSVSGEGGQSTIAIRGITTGNDTNPTVGVVLDDISYGTTVTAGTGYGVSVADIDPGDLQQIEVLRGPQGTLYGASSMGGLLKYVTVDPDPTRFSGRVQLGSTSVKYGDDLGYTARGSVNIPLSETAAIRASAYTLEDPGWVDNAETGKKDFNSRESEGGRVAALWKPSEDFSVNLSAVVQSFSRIGTDETDQRLGRGQFRQRFLPGTGSYDRDLQAYSATIKGTVGNVEITSLTGYSRDELRTKTDLTYSNPGLMFLPDLFFGEDRMFSDNYVETKKLSQELRAELPLGDRVKWLVGAFYTDEDLSLRGTNRASNDTGADRGTVFQLAYGPQTFKELAGFTTFTFQVSDPFDVQVGARYSDTEQSSQGIWTGPQSALVFGADPRILPREVAKDNATTYLFTPRWKINEDMMAYARLASGYRPGGPNNGCGHSGVPCRFDPDTTRNYDVGIKGQVGVFGFDAAAYLIKWSDIQIPGLYSPDFLFAYTANVASAESKGVELSLQLRPIDNVVLSAWGAYSDAKLTADFPADQIFLVGRSGDRLPYSPEVSGNFSADWTIPFTSGNSSASLGAVLSYVGDRIGGYEGTGTPREVYPSYTKLDLTAGFQFNDWSMQLFANNATDKRVILRGGTDSQFTSDFVTYLQPRTFGVSLSKTF